MWKKKEARYTQIFFPTRDDNEVDVEGEEKVEEGVGHMNLTELLLVPRIVRQVFFM
jgi:hypothetical protein